MEDSTFPAWLVPAGVTRDTVRFDEAWQEFTRLHENHSRGGLSAESLSTEVSGLKVLDSDGMWWQPDPGGGGWQTWDGWGWKAASPAGESPVQTIWF